MPSAIVVATGVESGLGFLLNSAILYLVLSRGRKPHHYFFSALLLICAIWDLGVLLLMVRNTHLDELPAIGAIICLPCGLIPAVIFHFANLYTGQRITWAIVTVWAVTAVIYVIMAAGLYFRIDGAYTYPWGNVFRVLPGPFDAAILATWFIANLWACALLLRASRQSTSVLQKRHCLYLFAGLLVITFAIVKTVVVMGIDLPWALPLGMLLNDVFVALIGLAIVKDRLFDITLIIKRGALYSALAALLIFVYSLTEHMLITYVGEAVGASSAMLRFLSVALGIALLMPVKGRLERWIDAYFGERKLAF